ncbi:MAG: PA14 domain-containing protein [Candidatus Omnitrophica bacterium]|nr:PA14 domain-containing protein [Candidatus Omnitrophota bacterium]
MKHWTGKNRRGIALLLTIGVLGLISLIGISFALNMLLTRKEAANFLNSSRARYIAEAGIKRAVMDIRAQVTSVSYTNLKTYIANYVVSSGTNVPLGEGTYTLTITSEEDKVNLNTFDETDASQIDILKTFLTNQQVANIIDYRDTDSTNTAISGISGNIEGAAQCKNKPFDSINEIRAATGIDQNTFANNKDKITVYKPIMRGGLLGKYYGGASGPGISGVSPDVTIDKAGFAKKVVELGPVYQTPNDTQLPGTDGYESTPSDVGWSETHDAEFAGGSSVATIVNFGVDRFGVIWDGYIEIMPDETGAPITFRVMVDDGAKLFLDDNTANVLQGTSWQDQDKTEYSGDYTFQAAGWHKIRIEYYDNTYGNTVMLKWKGASWAGASVVPAERLGYDPLMKTGLTYNHAGIYTITSTASVLSSGLTAATRQLTATVEVFGTWTQTTKEEFCAAWFNEQGNFRDGEVFNVNWLDSCPTEGDYWDAGASKMRWEEAGTYTKTPDSVKLGYWDNFDEDPAFSTAMMKGYQWNRSWWNIPDVTLNISFQDVRDNDGDGDNEIYIKCNTFEAKHFELNRYYFKPDTQSVFVRAYLKEPAPSTRIAWRGNGILYPFAVPPAPPMGLYPGAGRDQSGNYKSIYYYDENGNGQLDYHQNPVYPFNYILDDPQVFPVYDAYNGDAPVYIYSPEGKTNTALEPIPAPGSYHYWQPEGTGCGCWLFAKGSADDPQQWANCLQPNGYKTLLTDAHGTVQVLTEPRPLWPDGDTCEIRLYQGAFFHPQFDYLAEKVMAMIGSDSDYYYSWVNGVIENSDPNWAAGYPSNPIFKFVANNQYLGADWTDLDRGQHIIGANDTWPYAGAVTEMQTHWDDIRCIPPSGYLVSTPFYSGGSIKWGTVSWSAQTPSGNTAGVYFRTASSYNNIPALDSGWTAAASNGAAIGGTNPWIQYKIALAKSDINKGQYTTSSQTPVFEDLTCTYLPTARIKYWREGS